MSRASTKGVLLLGQSAYPCVIGRAGLRMRKIEGDGTSPIGYWAVHAIIYRQDRQKKPTCDHDSMPTRHMDGWCDDPLSMLYNTPVAIPTNVSFERLWRDDHLYDVVIITNHNDNPVRKWAGSAIFIHLAAPDSTPTEGCVALGRRDMNRILPRLTADTRLLLGQHYPHHKHPLSGGGRRF
jgi:L,D-peptidoglycan transpeptidase YkuD (ErfK/YbiS/YcfS/YnhG family)